MENYQSYIKIKGLHLLPPLVTEKQRAELRRYKQQAIKLENRLTNCRQLKKNLEDLMNAKLLSETADTNKRHAKRNLTTDLVNVTDYVSSEIKEMNGKDVEVNEIYVNVTDYISSGDKTTNRKQDMGESIQEKANSSSETFDSTYSIDKSSQTSNNCFRNTDLAQLEADSIECTEMSEQHTKSTPAHTSHATSPSQPRLIRSNSYTLETPSPILLAHLERISKASQSSSEQKLDPSRTSLEDSYVPFEKSEFSSMDTVLNTDDLSCSEGRSKGRESPQVSVVHTDISVQHISVNADESDDKKLKEVLEKIPEDYSKQILELIEKHFGSSSDNKPSTEVHKNVTVRNTHSPMRSTNTITVRSSASPKRQSSEIDVSDKTSATQFHFNQNLLEKAEQLIQGNISKRVKDYSDEIQHENIQPYTVVRMFEENESSSRLMPQIEYCPTLRRKLSFSGYLSPSQAAKSRKDWAAHVIGAHVRGYLTRRLLKTERVQSLIMTIKDALMCALQLHTADNINEADVELHRRLITQVSSACYAFHDVFFAYSIPEQMCMIAADRRRIIEKSRKRRSNSAPTSHTRLSSSSRSRRSIPQTRSLTHV